MNIRYWYIVTLLIIACDQLSKIFTDGKVLEVFPGFIGFLSTHNIGASFSILEGAKWLFIILGILFVIGLVLFDFLNKKDYNFNAWYKLGFSLVLGGTIGNLIDRIAFGYVRDFICTEFMNFPIFNIADIALCVGTGCLIVWVLFFCKDKTRGESIK